MTSRFDGERVSCCPKELPDRYMAVNSGAPQACRMLIISVSPPNSLDFIKNVLATKAIFDAQ